MEYMMINRSLKAGGNSSDIPTATLGRISDRQNNSNRHNPVTTNSHLHFTQQHQPSTSASNFASTFRSTNLTSNCINTNHESYGSSDLQASAVGRHCSRQPPKINFSFKSQSAVLNRIAMSSSMRTLTTHSGSFVGLPRHNLSRSETVNSSNTQRRNNNPLMTTKNFQETSDFDSEPPVLLVGVGPSLSHDQQANMSLSTSVKDEDDNRHGNSLWETAVEPNGVLKKYRKLKFRSVPLAAPRVPPPMPKSSTTSALVSILRKRKACNSANASAGTALGNNLCSPNNKKPKLSFGPITFKSGLSKASKKESLNSQMPNLMKTVGDIKQPQSSLSSSSGDLFKRNTKAGKHSTDNVSASAVIGSRPPIPTENVFLKKYDPLRLLSRLRCAPVSSKGNSSSAGTSLMVEPRKILRSCSYSSPSRKKRHQDKSTNRQKLDSSLLNKTNKSVISDQTSISPWADTGDFKTKQRPRIKARYRHKKKVSKKRKKGSKEKRNPKLFASQTKHRIKYNSSKKNISLKRLRVMAAVSLRRALKTMRKRKFSKAKRFLSNTKQQSRSQTPSMSIRTSVLKMLKSDHAATVTRNGELKSNQPIPKQNPRALAVPESKLNFYKCKPPPAKISGQVMFPTPANPYMLHTIELLRHKRQLQERNDAMESSGVVYKLDPQPGKPTLPKKYPYLYRNHSLNGREAKHILSQQLLINLAHSGFTHAKLRPLEVLADATESFLTKMCLRLKEISEIEMNGADHQFSDPMERMLTEIGFGGIRGVQDFYRTKIKEYGFRMGEQCLLLRRQYAYKVRSKIGLGNSTSTSTCSTPSAKGISASTTVISSVSNSSGNGNNASGGKAVTTNSSKSTCITTSIITNTTSSSLPLSPGNSVLAEMLSSQEELLSSQNQQVRPLQCQSSPLASTGMEKQLEELMGPGAVPPPNVEIRPNSFPSRQQLLPLTSLSQPATLQGSLPNGPNPVQNVPHIVQSSQSLQRPVRTIAVQQQKGFQQQLFQVSPQQSSLQGQPQQQQSVSLTQLLQRPIANQQGSPSPATPSGHPQQNPKHHIQSVMIHGNQQQQQQPLQHAPTLQAQPVSQQQHSSTVAAQQLTQRSLNVTSASPGNCRQVLTIPIQMNMTRNPGQSPQSLHDQLTTPMQLTSCPTSIKPTSTTRGKSVTIIRSGSSPGITVSGDKARLVNSNQNTAVNSPSSIDVFSEYSPVNNTTSNPATPTFHQQLHGGMSNNVISINLGSNNIDLDTGGGGVVQPQTVTMHAVEATTISQGSNSNSASKAKLKETINQRNLLRLNFEQVPSVGDSTVLLSSSSTPSSVGTTISNTGSVQFLGKVSSGQTISWSSNYP